MDMCLLPHQTESLSSAKAGHFIDLLEFCGFMDMLITKVKTHTESMVGLIFHPK